MAEDPHNVMLSAEKVAALVERAIRARQNGDLPAARALLRALAAQRPDLPQIWLALATAAESRAEQRQALERVIALDPQNPLAQRGLARMRAASAPPAALPEPAPAAAPSTTAPPAHAPEEIAASVGAAPALTPMQPTPEEHARSIRWPLYLVLGVGLLIVLLAFWWLRPTPLAPADTPVPTLALPGAQNPPPGAAPQATPALSVPTACAGESAPNPAAGCLPATPPPTPALPTPAPPTAEPTPPTLAIGQVVQTGDWHVALLRPADAVPLEGSIGAFQPRGRFLLALVAVGNDGTVPAPMPADMVALVDRAGNRYLPQPAISTAYLAVYGRGQRGDLSMEDAIPSDGGNKSIPLIFDIPAAARDLRLLVRGGIAGWPVGD